jgi:hypothetical protein
VPGKKHVHKDDQENTRDNYSQTKLLQCLDHAWSQGSLSVLHEPKSSCDLPRAWSR